MDTGLKRLPIRFYQSANGREPVREWLKSLSAEDRKILGTDLRTLEFGWPIGMPLCRAVGHGLWEVRSSSLLPTSPRESRFSMAYSHPQDSNPMTWRYT